MTNYYSNSIDYHNDLDAFEARVRAEEAEAEEPTEQEEKETCCCCCYEYAGDNRDCPVHGRLSDEEAKADYQERKDLYTMGMGY